MTPQQRYDAERLAKKYTSTAEAVADATKIRIELDRMTKEFSRVATENRNLQEEIKAEKCTTNYWKQKAQGIR